MQVDDPVARALDIGPDSAAVERTIDITTVGARTGIPRRIEVWFHQVDGHWYITGVPGPRNWYANLRAHPRFTVHLKHGVTADLSATAAPVPSPFGSAASPISRAVQVPRRQPKSRFVCPMLLKKISTYPSLSKSAAMMVRLRAGAAQSPGARLRKGP